MTIFSELPLDAIFIRIRAGVGEVLRVKVSPLSSRVVVQYIPATMEIVLSRGDDNSCQEDPSQPVQLVDSREDLKIVS